MCPLPKGLQEIALNLGQNWIILPRFLVMTYPYLKIIKLLKNIFSFKQIFIYNYREEMGVEDSAQSPIPINILDIFFNIIN